MPARDLSPTPIPSQALLDALQVELGFERAGSLATLRDRASRRLERQEARRQINLENIARRTLDRVAIDAAGAIDPLWLARFAESAAEIEDESLQDLWSRALAQEATRPGAISLRTLTVLRDLSGPHVSLFAGFARFAINNFVMRLEEAFFEGKGLAPDDLLLFEELGLLRPGSGQVKTFKSQSEDSYVTHLLYRDQVLRVTHETNKKPLALPCHRLTAAGAELAEILPVEEDSDYIVGMTGWLAKRGYRVAQARINARSDRNTVTSHSPFCELYPYDRRRRLKRAGR
ncbi:MAG: DUF2806 domain-containing protein [Alphaproteobacteria bacterium]|nr:DUF2806 domain-containing protein [Alphaproteobacteria bacterium]